MHPEIPAGYKKTGVMRGLKRPFAPSFALRERHDA